MPSPLFVHLLPSLFEPAAVAGSTVVVVDILRASTTMSYALAHGAAGVVPCLTIDDALKLRNAHSNCLLGGERGGVKIDSFDLSNSPDDYSRNVIENRLIGFTTTNGTKALLRARQANRILVGAFVNVSAVIREVEATPDPIHIVCAGTNGAITSEDVLFAGVLTDILARSGDREMSDSAMLARNHWRQECGELSASTIEAALHRSQGGRNLRALDYHKDIATAARPDEVDAIGCLDSDGVIRLLPTKESR